MAKINTHQQSNNIFLKGIEGEYKWNAAALTYAFAKSSNIVSVISDSKISHVFEDGANFDALDASNPKDNAIRNDVLAAMKAWELVAKVPTYTATSDFAKSDIKIAGVSNWGSELGRMDFPGTNFKEVNGRPQFNDLESTLLLNTGKFLTDRAELGGGHLGAQNSLHELGHGLGLAHPHDHGGSSKKVSSPSITAHDEVAWDNQRYTVMSYEKPGWNQNAGGNFGFAVTPSALDITAIQNMYGATKAYESDTTYTLTDAGTRALDINGTDGNVQIGRAFYSIWDTGGSDTIAYNGQNRSILNLNNATLSTIDSERLHESETRLSEMKGYAALPAEITANIESPDYHGGGFFSMVFSNAGIVQLGGFSIASDIHNAKAKIENANGGFGDDVIIGNEVDNFLFGGAGNDIIISSSGNDSVFAGHGDDQLAGEAGNDQLDGGAGNDTVRFADISSNYSLNMISSNILTVSHVKGSRSDGTDTLLNIEKLAFSDSTFSLNPQTSRHSAIDAFIFDKPTAYLADSSLDEVAFSPYQAKENSSCVYNNIENGFKTDSQNLAHFFETADEFMI